PTANPAGAGETVTHAVPGRHRAPTRLDLLLLSARAAPRRPAMAVGASGGLVATALFGGSVPHLPPPSELFGSVVVELPTVPASAFFSAYDARSPEAARSASRASAARAAVTRAAPTAVPAAAALGEPAVETSPADLPVVAVAAPADGEVDL